MKRTMQRLGQFCTALALAGWATLARAVNDLPGGPAVNQLDLHPAVTAIAAEQRWLHYFVMVICTFIFVAVFGVMFYSIFKHRKSRGHRPSNFHESTAIEVAWTVVPFVIVIGMAWPATKVLVDSKDTTASDLTIKATGYQWRWGYDYINGEGAGIAFLSTLDPTHRLMSDSGNPEQVDNYLLKVDNPLVVPVDKKVRIITTGADVIHAFAVNSLGIKQDAIPGFVRDTWFRARTPGDFYGQCQELCGKEHAYMPIHVKVLPQAEYTAWAQGELKKIAAKADDPAKVWTLDELVARGEKVYTANCAVCHRPDGKGAGPIKALDGSAVVLDKDHGKQLAVLLDGAAGGAMPAWKQLSDTDLAAVMTYTRNSWSNKTGQIVQPAQVLGGRK